MLPYLKDYRVYEPSISEATAGSPVELERAVAVGDLSTVEAQSFGCSGWATEVNEAIAGTGRYLSLACYSSKFREEGTPTH